MKYKNSIGYDNKNRLQNILSDWLYAWGTVFRFHRLSKLRGNHYQIVVSKNVQMISFIIMLHNNTVGTSKIPANDSITVNNLEAMRIISVFAMYLKWKNV